LHISASTINDKLLPLSNHNHAIHALHAESHFSKNNPKYYDLQNIIINFLNGILCFA
jgi:hypothetical protein